MALKITCPNCGEPHRLTEPYPLPGAEVQCHACRRPLTISYPPGLMTRLRGRGAVFQDDLAQGRSTTARAPDPLPVAPGWLHAEGLAPEPEAVAAPPADPATQELTEDMPEEDVPKPEPEPPPVAVPDPGPTATAPALPKIVQPTPVAIAPPDVAPGTAASQAQSRPPPPVAIPRPNPAFIPPPPVVPSHLAAPEPPRPAEPEAEPAPAPIATAPAPVAPPPPVVPVPATPSKPVEAAPAPYGDGDDGADAETVLEGHWSSPTSRTERFSPAEARIDDTAVLDAGSEAPPPAPPPTTVRTVEPAASRPEKPRVEARQTRRSAPREEPRRVAHPAPESPPPPRRGRLARLALRLMVLALVAGALGLGGLVGIFWYYGRELPTVEALGRYRPPTVTVVHDRKGQVIGEIYERRRYVVELKDIPKTVQDAFIAAEDANFWNHSGVDVAGIFRAVGRNLAKGKAAQGASTITQQVARNFLLTSEKTVTRKVKEIILARRIEAAFDKEHILYLYLNQIYLGSGAYGVEAASRTYFDKHVSELTLPEAAILAGLPQRPSDYSPLQHWEKARAREEYVLGQMLQKGYIDRATYDTALATPVDIVNKDNPFLTAAPYFTEHIRRYLVETYGFDKVYNDGLSVDTTCDLDLQKTAQEAVESGAVRADNRVGWRGPLSHLGAGEIEPHLDTQERALREEASHLTLRVAAPASGQGGYAPMPDVSPLQAGRRYEAVVMSVGPRHAVVGIGKHRALIPLSWSSWTYKPNPDRSWKSRSQDDLTRVLNPGDVVEVTLEGLSSEDFDNLKGFTDAGPGPFAAARLYQAPELESALLSYRLDDGAVLAMVGGVDFQHSEFNRATQAQRQVGSTFKPIVYAAAIESRKITAGSIVQDAPLVFNVLDEKLWKPDNYGDNFLGNITLRKALQMSRNVCTIRVLDKVGLDGVFALAGSKLRIGYDQPSCHRNLIDEGGECDGNTEPSPVAGKVWCTGCDPSSCPYIQTSAETSCLDTPVAEGEATWCHSCDVNLRVCDWIDLDRMPEGERCLDARKDVNGKTVCRACDLSMGLGSSSLTMVELARAYSAFATYGHLVEPHWIDRVVDRDGTVIEAWKAPDSWPQVIDKGVASVAHWLLTQVVQGGTASKAQHLGLNLAGKTGTTNDFFDAWFVGYNPDVLTAVWVGYDTPRSMGQSFTGGETALPIWMDYMAVAVPKKDDRPFPPLQGVEFVPIDESTGRVAKGGYPIPMLPGTAPTNAVVEVGQKTSEDLLTSDF